MMLIEQFLIYTENAECEDYFEESILSEREQQNPCWNSERGCAEEPRSIFSFSH